MPVTEFAILEALAPYTVDASPVQTFLADVARQQAAWSGFPLLFFRDAAAPATVYLVSGWTDVPAHEKWIASEPNQELLRRAALVLAVKAFFHLDINFETMPVGVQCVIWEALPDDIAQAELGGEVVGGARSGLKIVWEGAGRVLEEQSGDIHRLRGYTRVEGEEDISQRYYEGNGSTSAGSAARARAVKAVLFRMNLRN